jgi:hypothetical protein
MARRIFQIVKKKKVVNTVMITATPGFGRIETPHR